MTDQALSFNETLVSLQADRDARRFDGTQFEDAVLRHAAGIPSWEITECWRYLEWPGRTSVGVPLPPHDAGIDLVAVKRDGSRVAIQCKARSGGGSVTTKQVQQLAGAAPSSVFAERWMVAEARRSAATEDAAAVADVTFIDFEAALTEARDSARERSATEPDPRTAMQDEAVAACVRALRAGLPEHRDRWRGRNPADWMPRDAARATLVLPCGTGKTRVSMRILSELSEPGDVGVVLVPSIALIAQVRREYLSHIGHPVRTLAVCSDTTAGHVDIEQDPNLAADPTRDTGQVRAAEIGCRVAQNADAVAEWLRAGVDSTNLRIIFSTYQSAHHTADALLTEQQFAQVLILDEAHRTAQLRPAKSQRQSERLRVFTLCHHQEAFPARYRLYQTATPRVYDASNAKVARIDRTKWVVMSMSDESIFGPVAYRLAYKDAVEKAFLSDYRIIAIGVDDRAWAAANRIVQMFEQSPETRGLTTRDALSWLVYGVALAGGTVGDGVRVSRSLAFLNKVQRSSQMVEWLKSDDGRSEIERYFADGGFVGTGRPYAVEHLDAGHPVRERRRALRELAAADAEQPRGIANVGIFGEGTDSPSLDAVALLAPRRSPTDVIQIVGRCMRRAPGKRYGYVIVPVPLPRGIDAETSLSMDTLGEEWKVLGEVLRALRAHDGRIEDEISHLLRIYVPPEDEVPVRQPLVVRDGAVTRLGVWTGPRGHAEDALERADVPAWRDASAPGAAPITEYLTEEKGFEWRPEPAKAGDPERFTDGPSGEDERMLEESPAVLVVQRGRGGVRCTVQAASRSTERHGGVDVAKTVEQARERAESLDPLPRRPRRRPARRGPDKGKSPAGASPTQRLLEQIREDGVGRDLRVEVMEKSGLRGNEVRDFNLLMEPVRRAAEHLSREGLEGRLRSVLGMEHLQETDTHADACTVSVLLLMNAALLHARLEGAKGQAADLARVGLLHDAATGSEPVAVLREAWTAVLRYDYEPVFRPALNVLEALAAADALGGVNQAVRAVAAWAKENAEIYVSMGMEYAGELFSRVLGNQASDGAFFTRQPAARLLAELALDATGETEWAERRTWRRLKVADLACGSGTLLNAYLEAVKDRIRKSGGGERGAAEFHKYAVERLVTGLDINPVSLQMAAGRMTLANPSVDYRKMALRAMPYGSVEGETVRLGTLELLTDEDVVGTAATDDDGGKQQQPAFFDSAAVDPEVVQDVEDRRLVMMNPPFTANDKKGRKFTPEVTKALQRRELQIRDRLAASDEEAAGVIDANSIRTMFTPLAEKVLAEDRGVLATIMPVTACTGASGLRERRFLASRFHLDMILCSHDPREPNLSTHTSINECLLIAKRNRGTSRATTMFVNLRRFPKSVDAVHEVVDAIRNRRIDEVGSVCEWPQDLVRAGDWSPVQWFDPALALAARKVKELPGMARLGDTCELAPPPGGRFMHAFERVGDGAVGPDDVATFDSVSTRLRTSMTGVPDASWRPRPGKDSLVTSYLARAGWVLLAARARTNNAAVVAVWSREKCLGNAYVAVVTNTVRQAKALCVLWNSTPTLLQLLSMRSKMLMYPKWSVGQLESVSVPELIRTTAVQSALASAFDRLRREPLRSWAYADTDSVRREIDDAIAEAYAIPRDVLADWRERLAKEPTIANRSPI